MNIEESNFILGRQMLVENQMVRTNHLLHLVLCVLTLTLWSVPWAIVHIMNTNSNNRKRAEVSLAPDTCVFAWFFLGINVLWVIFVVVAIP